jgi:hypothetical protein
MADATWGYYAPKIIRFEGQAVQDQASFPILNFTVNRPMKVVDLSVQNVDGATTPSVVLGNSANAMNTAMSLAQSVGALTRVTTGFNLANATFAVADVLRWTISAASGQCSGTVTFVDNDAPTLTIASA